MTGRNPSSRPSPAATGGPGGAPAAALFPEYRPVPHTPSLISTPVTNPDLASRRRDELAAKRAAALAVLPARRRAPDRRPPADELRERRLRDGTKNDIADAVWSVLMGLETAPLELELHERRWLEGLLKRACRAHLGIRDVECPGAPECRGTIDEPAVTCEHSCPLTPACPGSLGRLLACGHARLYLDRGCGNAIAEPISCHVPACPDCEPQRQAKHAAHYEAIVNSFDWRDLVLAVFTAENPRAGELRKDLRRNTRDLAKLRRTPIFTGSSRCLARAPAGGPMHVCTHPECVRFWKCTRRIRCDGGRGRGTACGSRARGRCAHPECRPNCRRYRHRGVRAGVFAMECPPSEKTPGTWNLHTNAILLLRDRGDGDRRYKPYLAEWSEVSWYWARATCRVHRRCPGRPRCRGGAWDVHLEAYEPKAGIREYLKYVTKPAAVLEHAGAGGMVEFMLARRRVKFLSAFGEFFGRGFMVDPDEQAIADAETVMVWISPFRRKRMPKICAACGQAGKWDTPLGWDAGEPKTVPRVDLELVSGFLFWRGPPP